MTDPAWVAMIDQAGAASKDLAKVAASYWTELIVQGVSEQAATEIVVGIQQTLVAIAAQKMDTQGDQ